jgi:molybdopterin-guanine dinucleotide biosynthesis protein MobB
MINSARVPIVGFAAHSGTGKTTLLVKLLALLGEQGLRVGVIKHAHHGFEIDRPGKDSYELRRAGAQQTLIGSRHRWVLIVETGDWEEPMLDEYVRHMDQDRLDLILVEGFKPSPIPKIELYRPALGKPLLFPGDPSIIAVATDGALPVPASLPVLDLNRPREIADFIIDRIFRASQNTPVSAEE